MDDLLERMLAVDLEGRQLVSQAEEQAIKIREENSSQVAEINAQYSARLSEECAAVEQETLAAAQARRESELASAASGLDERAAKFSQSLGVHRGALLKRLMGI